MQKELGGIGTMIRMMSSMSYNRDDYDSAQDFLSKLQKDNEWQNQLQRLENFSPEELDKHREIGNNVLRQSIPHEKWYLHEHDVEYVVGTLWNERASIFTLIPLTIWMLSLVWIDQHEKMVEENSLNHEAPIINLQRLLQGNWFEKLRTKDEYNKTWTNAFVSELMASEWKDDIARDWAVAGAREKKKQLKGYIVGLLKDAGVLNGSYDSIAAELKITTPPRTFSRYMCQGKKQPYADWVKNYVNNMPVS